MTHVRPSTLLYVGCVLLLVAVLGLAQYTLPGLKTSPSATTLTLPVRIGEDGGSALRRLAEAGYTCLPLQDPTGVFRCFGTPVRVGLIDYPGVEVVVRDSTVSLVSVSTHAQVTARECVEQTRAFIEIAHTFAPEAPLTLHNHTDESVVDITVTRKTSGTLQEALAFKCIPSNGSAPSTSFIIDMTIGF